jgi:hypothetical protein
MLSPAARSKNAAATNARLSLARPERLELPTLWFEARCSIQLSYGRAEPLYLSIQPASPSWREISSRKDRAEGKQPPFLEVQGPHLR